MALANELRAAAGDSNEPFIQQEESKD